jgi:ribosomal protein S27AE
MSAWHELHQYYSDPDPDPPAMKRHCKQCGSFLSKLPNLHTYHIIPAKWDYEYDNGEISGMTILAEQKEPIDLWVCSKCHCQHEADDMYDSFAIGRY